MDSAGDGSAVAAAAGPDPNRVFVAGISTCCEETLRSVFAKFGPVHEVVIVGQNDAANSSWRKYCFVTFDDAVSAQRALASKDPSDVYKEIRPATAPTFDPRRRSNRSKAKESDRLETVVSVGRDANLIVQVQTTHLDRVVAHLHRRGGAMGVLGNCNVLGSTAATNSKNLTLLYLTCDAPAGVARRLSSEPLLARAIHKSYIVEPGLLEGNLATKEGCDDLSEVICERLSKEKGLRSIRMNVYPPKDRQRLLQSLEAIVDESDASSQQFTINPKEFSHILSVVEVYRYKGRGWEAKQNDENSRRYMMGIFPASPELDVVDTNNILSNDTSGDEVCRAYFKLKEAVETYEAMRGALERGLYGAIALDCGSAPGGWTKYLIERFRCPKVFSVDPGELASTVLELEETAHMQMKIQDALPVLLADDDAKGGVQIWVSDMCLHELEEQVDRLVVAKESGLLAPNSFFVLTLKCIKGYSKSSFDSQVKTAVDKLLASATVVGVETLHLFTNRVGERTVVGYIN
ncbi:hypothetical protein ACHAXT_011956 [Thalassiosira profunda]